MTADPKALRELAAAIDPPQIYVSPLARAAAAAALYALATELSDRPSLLAAAERVVWFDWSGNDHDAVMAMAALRAAVTSAGSTPAPKPKPKPTALERKLMKLLDECASCIEEEVRDEDDDHPTIRKHRRTAKRARAAIAKASP